jgi:catechol 2,3-dioxygenase-like lactoylglutathione lyase family enzyme
MLLVSLASDLRYSSRMGKSTGRLPTGGFARLVPELDVFDLAKSRAFWCDVLGFQIAYQRAENGFMFIELQGSQLMLNRRNGNWETGDLQRPLGRGINFQMFVDSVEPLLDALRKADWPFFEECHDAWYRIAGDERGNRQFLVQDPDGYLLRFAQDLGKR